MPMKARYTVIDGEVIAEKRNGVRKQYVPDPLGSTVAMLDNTQAQTDTFSYWPYGEVASRTGITPTPFQFVGTKGYYKSNTTFVDDSFLLTSLAQWADMAYGMNIDGSYPTYVYASGNPTTLYGQASRLIGIGHVPPGKQIGHNHLGETGCNLQFSDLKNPWFGTCYSIIDSSKCYAKCLDAHEGQHRYDDKKCCAAAAKCLRSSHTQLQMLECAMIWEAWWAATKGRSECQAYQDELDCEEQMSKDLGCANNATAPCCKSLAQRQDKVKHKFIPQSCGTTLWPRSKATQCKFPR